jgi:hypothetical protein
MVNDAVGVVEGVLEDVGVTLIVVEEVGVFEGVEPVEREGVGVGVVVGVAEDVGVTEGPAVNENDDEVRVYVDPDIPTTVILAEYVLKPLGTNVLGIVYRIDILPGTTGSPVIGVPTVLPPPPPPPPPPLLAIVTEAIPEAASPTPSHLIVRFCPTIATPLPPVPARVRLL